MNNEASAAFELCQTELSENVFTEGSIGRAVWQMAWPLLLTSTLSSCVGLVDMYLAGFMGDAAQAAIGIGEQFIFLAVTIGTGLCIGCQALISRCVGARQLGQAWLYIKDSLYATALIGLVATVTGIVLAKEIFACFAAEPLVNELGVRYLQLTSLGNLPFVLAMTLTAVFRAYGAPRYALYVWTIITVVSITSAFAFVFSDMPWGVMSVDSLAWSWNLGATLGVICGFVLLARLRREAGACNAPLHRTGVSAHCNETGLDANRDKKSVRAHSNQTGLGANRDEKSVRAHSNQTGLGAYRNEKSVGAHSNQTGLGAYRNEKSVGAHCMRPEVVHELRPSVTRMREILALGLPATIAELSWVVSNFLMFVLFANFPQATAAQAAWSVAYKLEETVASYPLLALSLAAAAVVGQNLGAGKTSRAFKAALIMGIYAGVAMFAVGCLLTLASVPLVSLFSQDALVIHYGQLLLSASPLVLPLLAVWLVFFGAVEGAGVTTVPMIFNAAGYLLIRLPLAWALALPAGLGMNGVFIALFVSRFLLSLIAGMVFLRRKWLKVGLLQAT